MSIVDAPAMRPASYFCGFSRHVNDRMREYSIAFVLPIG
jgi:hypothetical protein